MPWMPGHVLTKWDAELTDLRVQVLAVTRELGESRAEAERWRGQAEALAAQLMRMQEELSAARRALQDAQRKGEDEDPWAHDEGEHRRILQGMLHDPEDTLRAEGGTPSGRAGTKMSG